MMDSIVSFLASDEFRIGQMFVNWLMLYVFFRLGRKRGFLNALDFVRFQDKIIEAQHQKLTVAQAHIDNLNARLEELNEQHRAHRNLDDLRPSEG